MRYRLASIAAVAVCAYAIAPAAFAAPLNDNFLSPGAMMTADGRVAAEYVSDGQIDTSDATTQPDLFAPSAAGLAGGGGPEPTTCGAAPFGKTVWFTFRPQTSGGAEIIADGFDTVVAVYRVDPITTKLAAQVACQNSDALGETVLLPSLDRGANYAVQVGGAANATGFAGGPLDFRFSFFPDSDRDGVLDERPDRCPNRAGILAAGGCPPQLAVSPRLAWIGSGGGIRFTRLTVDRVAQGSRIEARCAVCKLRQRVIARRSSGAFRLSRFLGPTVPIGATIEISVTHPASGSGRFRYGAFGTVIRYRVRRGARGAELSPPTNRCLEPGSRIPRRTCR